MRWNRAIRARSCRLNWLPWCRRKWPRPCTLGCRYSIDAGGRVPSPEATLVGPEAQCRLAGWVCDEQTLESPTVRGLLPVGEGAGYAGGIVSACARRLAGRQGPYPALRAAGFTLDQCMVSMTSTRLTTSSTPSCLPTIDSAKLPQLSVGNLAANGQHALAIGGSASLSENNKGSCNLRSASWLMSSTATGVEKAGWTWRVPWDSVRPVGFMLRPNWRCMGILFVIDEIAPLLQCMFNPFSDFSQPVGMVSFDSRSKVR